MASNPKSSRAMQFLVWGSAFIVFALAAFAIRSLTREQVSVHVAQVGYGDLMKESAANGKVEPNEDFQAHARVAGQVQDIDVEVGDKVKPGQLLLKMEDR